MAVTSGLHTPVSLRSCRTRTTAYQCSPITVHLDLVLPCTDPGCCCFFAPPASPPPRRAGESIFLNTDFGNPSLSCTRREITREEPGVVFGEGGFLSFFLFLLLSFLPWPNLKKKRFPAGVICSPVLKCCGSGWFEVFFFSISFLSFFFFKTQLLLS